MPTTDFEILISGTKSHVNKQKWPDGLQAGMEPHQRCTEVYLTRKSVMRANFKKTHLTHAEAGECDGTKNPAKSCVLCTCTSVENICLCVCARAIEVAALEQQNRAEPAYLSCGSLGNMTTIKTVPQLLNYSFSTGTNHISGKSVCPSPPELLQASIQNYRQSSIAVALKEKQYINTKKSFL